jgi:hypothetical protein
MVRVCSRPCLSPSHPQASRRRGRRPSFPRLPSCPPSRAADLAATAVAPYPTNRLVPSPLELCTPASDSKCAIPAQLLPLVDRGRRSAPVAKASPSRGNPPAPPAAKLACNSATTTSNPASSQLGNPHLGAAGPAPLPPAPATPPRVRCPDPRTPPPLPCPLSVSPLLPRASFQCVILHTKLLSNGSYAHALCGSDPSLQ